jgi:hypothetical protein
MDQFGFVCHIDRDEPPFDVWCAYRWQPERDAYQLVACERGRGKCAQLGSRLPSPLPRQQTGDRAGRGEGARQRVHGWRWGSSRMSSAVGFRPVDFRIPHLLIESRSRDGRGLSGLRVEIRASRSLPR